MSLGRSLLLELLGVLWGLKLGLGCCRCLALLLGLLRLLRCLLRGWPCWQLTVLKLRYGFTLPLWPIARRVPWCR